MKISKKILSLIVLPAIFAVISCGGNTNNNSVLANAGVDQTVLINAVATLDGAGSTGVTSSRWTFTSKPDGSAATLTDDTTLTPTFTPDVEGDYEARLSVNSGASTAQVTITARTAFVSITVPTSSAITTRERLGTTEYVIDAAATGATLSASGSQIAALKKLRNATLSYQWEQIAGPKATLDETTTTTDTLSFTAPAIGDLQNQLALFPISDITQSISDSFKWQILPISRNDTKMTFRLTLNGADAGNLDVYLEDNGTEIHPTSGLPNVGVGAKVYLAGATYTSAPSGTTYVGTAPNYVFNTNGTRYTGWSWSMTPPDGSSATFDDSGTTTSTIQFPTFTPDVAGIYTIAFCNPSTACPTADTSGAVGTATAYNYTDAFGSTGTNVVSPAVFTPGTITINAGDYVGEGTIGGTTPTAPQCANCHDGTDKSGKDYGDVVSEWETTKHSHIFSDNMDTYAGLAPLPYLWQQHTTGFNTDADNGGFDDLIAAYTFDFPAAGITYSDFTANNPEVATLANVQCESCHGPGSEHQGDPVRIGKSASQPGICGQCHIEEDQWKLSLHNEKSSSGWGQWLTNPVCEKCHSSEGFQAFMDGGGNEANTAGIAAVHALGDVKDTAKYPEVFGSVDCQACHDPHDKTNDFQLRAEGNVTLLRDGSTIDAGTGAVCYECHKGNREIGEADCYSDATTGIMDSVCDTWDETATKYVGGYHDATQGPMLEGNQAFTDLNGDGTDDFTLLTTDGSSVNSFHSTSNFTLAAATGDATLDSQNNKCVTCHMSSYGPAADEPGYGQIGGHSFQMTSDIAEADTEDAGVENVAACQVCHGDKLTEFNRLARADYDGDGTLEGVQDEVKGLMINLTTYIQSLDLTHVQQTYHDTWTKTAKCLTDSECSTGSSGIGITGACVAGKCNDFTTLTGSYLAADGTFVGADLAFWGNTAAIYPASLNGTAGLHCTSSSCSNLNASADAGKNCSNLTKPIFTAATSKANLGYRQCNFIATSDTIKRAFWNLNSIYRDESYGIHNAGYTVRVLQGTYQALGVLLGTNKSGTATTSSFTYKTDYPNAELR